MSDQERIQLKKFRLLNYSPPLGNFSSFMTTSNQIGSVLDQKSALNLPNEPQQKHKPQNLVKKDLIMKASRNAQTKRVKSSNYSSNHFSKQSQQRNRPVGKVHLTTSQYNERTALARDILA